MVLPSPGQTWRHWKGGVYTIVALARMESDLSPVVVYGDANNTWVRCLADFMGVVEYEKNGQPLQPRFRLHDTPAPRREDD